MYRAKSHTSKSISSAPIGAQLKTKGGFFMKVIKEGKQIVGVMRVTCKTCQAELEITASDLKEEPGDGPFYPTVYSYKCPCCRRINYLGYNDLSEEILFDMND